MAARRGQKQAERPRDEVDRIVEQWATERPDQGRIEPGFLGSFVREYLLNQHQVRAAYRVERLSGSPRRKLTGGAAQ